MYIQDTWEIKDTVEYEIKYLGQYGEKGGKRNRKQNVTPEQIKKQNQKNREKRMRRLIKANFDKGDLWLTLKYPKGTRKETSEVKADLRKFIGTLRRYYKKEDKELKFIYRMEIGKQGGIHIHMIIPRIKLELIQKAWTHGRINYEPLDGNDYKSLAEYIVKQPTEEVMDQLSFIPEIDRKAYVKYSTSRNLIRPVPKRKEFKRKTLRKMLLYGPEATEGYVIDKSSIVQGTNPITGMNYIYYTERRIHDG